MKFLFALLGKVTTLALVVLISNLLLQIVMLEIVLDGEIQRAERTGCFDESSFDQQMEKFKMINQNNVSHIEVEPNFAEYATQLGAPMSMSIWYNIQSPIWKNKHWTIKIQRKGVNTGYYGNGY